LMKNGIYKSRGVIMTKFRNIFIRGIAYVRRLTKNRCWKKGLLSFRFISVICKEDYMLAISPGWELHVERGPDWLIVKIQSMSADGENPPFAETIWSLMQQHLTHRLVLELDQVPVLTSFLIEELTKLYRKIYEHDGVMRLCGLSVYNRRLLHSCRLDERLQPYHDRQEAVLGYSRPKQPR
jgi:anti-anti-sigma regulatory factor